MTLTHTFTKKHDASLSPLSLRERIFLKTLCGVVKRLDLRHAIPATSSNFSIRSQPGEFLISRSGLHKRNLRVGDFIRTNLNGVPVMQNAPRVSDETLLHAAIYKNRHDAGCVLHCHAPEVEFLRTPGQRFEDHEILKAMGFKTHECSAYLNVLRNSQNMSEVAEALSHTVFSGREGGENLPAFMLERHGIYVYGQNVEEAEQRLEAILHLCAFMGR